jgi:glycine/D-amino acid oxidase-like deaminating enzyme
MADVVVIGGGILGAATALQLAEAGAGDVVLLERGRALGTQTTRAGAGFVGYFAGELEAELAADSMAFYARVQADSGEDLGVLRSGLLFPAVSEAGVEMLRQEHERELAFAPRVELLDARETARLCPLLAAGAVHGGLFQPDAHQVPTTRVMAALARLLPAAGVDVRVGVEVRHVRVDGGRVRGVETNAGVVETRHVVNAAGAAAHGLGARDGVSIGAVPLLESRFVTEPVAGLPADLPMLLFFERDLLYVRREGDALLVGAIERELGERSRVPLDAPPPTSALPLHACTSHEELAARCADVIPAFGDLRVADRASGLPSWTPDGRHVLGPAPGVEGYVVLAGDNECGVTHGPGLARIAAELVVRGTTAADISPYRVGRFAGLDDAALVAGAVGQYLARHPPEAGRAATPFGVTLPGEA